jgi:cobalt/nickel transport system permease protein
VVGPWTVIVTRPGLEACGIVLAKSTLAIAAMALVGATTTPGEACHALQELRVPGLLVMVIALALRYVELMGREMKALRCARDLRRCGRPAPGEWREPGHLAGTLMVRTIERAERVHGAMLLRGFDGRFRLLESEPPRLADFSFLGAMTAACVGLGILGRW